MIEKKIPNILFVSRDDGGCGFYRCIQPSQFLTRAGLAHATHVLNSPTKEQLLESDLVIMQEMGTVQSMDIVRFLVENNIPYFAEFDDFVFHVSPHNLGGYGAWNPSTLFLHRSLELTRKALGMTVSTEQLAREFFPYNNNIRIVPNYLDKDLWTNPLTKKQDGKIRIGWAGGNAHADDLKMISKVISKIVDEYKGKVIFETMGMLPNELHGVFPMQHTVEICSKCGYEGKMHNHPGEQINNYPMVLSSKGWDIALAPLINTAFNNAKSDIKIKEYSAVGIPIIASPAQPYRDAAKSNAQILFADSFDEWYNAIKKLINNQSLRDDMVRKNKEWVSHYWIQDNIYKIFDVYKDVFKINKPS